MGMFYKGILLVDVVVQPERDHDLLNIIDWVADDVCIAELKSIDNIYPVMPCHRPSHSAFLAYLRVYCECLLLVQAEVPSQKGGVHLSNNLSGLLRVHDSMNYFDSLATLGPQPNEAIAITTKFGMLGFSICVLQMYMACLG